MTRDEYIAAWVTGFRASREGFNGECAFDHLEPSEREILSDDVSVSADDPMLVRMANEAFDRQQRQG